MTRWRTAALMGATVLVLAAGAGVATPAGAAAVCPTVSSTDGSVPGPYDHQDWSGCDLTGAVLTGADLTGTDLSGADLTSANLTGAHLVDVVLTGATVTDARFFRAVVTGVVSGGLVGLAPQAYQDNLVLNGYLVGSGSHVEGADLHGLDLSGMSLGDLAGDGADLAAADLHNDNLVNAHLANANLAGANLEYANLSGADLTGADLSGADLRFANLTGAGVGAADLTGATFQHTTCPDTTDSGHHQGGTCTGPTDYRAPVVTMRVPGTFEKSTKFTISWAAHDYAAAGGYASGVMWVRPYEYEGAAGTVLTPSTYNQVGSFTPPANTYVEAGTYGRTYCFGGRTMDHDLNADITGVATCTTTPFDERSWKRATGWSRITSLGYLGRSFLQTGRVGSSLTSPGSLVVKQAGLIATTCSHCGSVTLYIGGRRISSVSLHATRLTNRAVVSFPRLTTARTGTVRIVVSKAGLVRVDGIVTTAG